MLEGLTLLVSSPLALALMMLAIPIGMSFGAIPGLGGKVALLSVIPFLPGMDPVPGAVFLISLHAVVHTGAAAPTILLGIPGTGPSTAVVADGHGMARKGEAMRAIAAAAVASAVGGVAGAIFMASVVPFMFAVMKTVSYPEILLLCVFGLGLTAILSEGAMTKGLLTACFGLLVSWVGIDATYGTVRLGTQPNGANLHRNVIFRDGKDKADQIIPFSAYDSEDPEDLWQWMADYEDSTGGRVLAIPHGGNLSNGIMFDDVTLIDKKPIDKDYAERRMKWEPLYEVTQIKGDAEAHPFLSPNDEFADFGTWDRGSFGPELKTPDMLPKEYVRSAYKRGLEYEAALGVNPFKFGMLGSTDSHTSLSTTEENNFFGKVILLEPTTDPIRFEEVISGRPGPLGARMYARESIASGLAAVWARENTREALWDAMSRKEVFATTGTRLRVRVFGGFDYVESDLKRSDFAKYGYENGVPMGGDLTAAPDGEAPTLLVRAIRDADGANLDRVQIVKGWLDAEGASQERVYDVAVSDGRIIDTDGPARTPVGNTVDVADASYTNAIGAPFLEAFWQDPEFDPKLRAFYYVRVIEIPTPNWTTYDAKVLGVDLPADVSASIQDRAYTSPIWYTP